MPSTIQHLPKQVDTEWFADLVYEQTWSKLQQLSPFWCNVLTAVVVQLLVVFCLLSFFVIKKDACIYDLPAHWLGGSWLLRNNAHPHA